MSTVKVDTIQTTGGVSEIAIDKLKGVSSASSISVVGEGGSNTTNMQQGLAKSWCNFNGTGTIASRDSFNVGSLTDRGTGEYDINFITNMGNANHCPTANTNVASGANTFNSGGFAAVGTSHSSMTGNSTSTTSLGSFDSAASYADATLNFVSVDGDLA